jgi:hypothetical protein
VNPPVLLDHGRMLESGKDENHCQNEPYAYVTMSRQGGVPLAGPNSGVCEWEHAAEVKTHSEAGRSFHARVFKNVLSTFMEIG